MRPAAFLQESIARSPLYSGQIEGVGPRYCPSIEDKIVKFPDKATSPDLPGAGRAGYERGLREWHVDQHADRRAGRHGGVIPGLEQAEMIRPGYAIEYDAIDPRELGHHAGSEVDPRACILAGQINGTSGYEEAGCQGFVAGMQREHAAEAGKTR